MAANYTLLAPPSDPPPAAGKIRVGATLAKTRGLGVGDVLSLRQGQGTEGQPTRSPSRASYPPESALLTADLVLVGEQDFRALFGIPAGLYTDLILTVPDPHRAVTKVAEKVLRTLPDTRPMVRDEILRTYAALFDWREGMVMVLLSGAVLGVASTSSPGTRPRACRPKNDARSGSSRPSAGRPQTSWP